MESRCRGYCREEFLERLYRHIGMDKYPCIEKPIEPKHPDKMRLTGASQIEYKKSYPAKFKQYEKALDIYNELLDRNVESFFEKAEKRNENHSVSFVWLFGKGCWVDMCSGFYK